MFAFTPRGIATFGSQRRFSRPSGRAGFSCARATSEGLERGSHASGMRCIEPMGSATLFVGLLLSTLTVELTGVYPGGIIVPGYIALFIDQPLRIGVTLAAALLTLGTYRLMSRWLLLFGRRRFAMLILVGAAWSMLMQLVLPPLGASAFGWQVVGWVVPGLIANTLTRQSLLATALALGVTSAGTFLVMRLIAAIVR